MISHRVIRAWLILSTYLLLFSSIGISWAGEAQAKDFKVILFPLKVELQDGKPAFRVKVQVIYQGKSPVRLIAGENVFIRPKADFLERSIYFGSDPAFQMCSIRQVSTGGGAVSSLSRTMQPGEILEEEWTSTGQDINAATFKGQIVDGGVCMNKPGEYRVKVVFAAWSSSYNNRLYTEPSNEQSLQIP